MHAAVSIENATVRCDTNISIRQPETVGMVETKKKGYAVCGPVDPVLPILLVEDSLDDAELIAIALRRAGLQFSLACVDTEADFQRAMQQAPRLILCDFHLPRFNCERVLEAAAERATPVIVVSRHIDEDATATVKRLGACAVLSKRRLPELAREIIACLARLDSCPAADEVPSAG